MGYKRQGKEANVDTKDAYVIYMFSSPTFHQVAVVVLHLSELPALGFGG